MDSIIVICSDESFQFLLANRLKAEAVNYPVTVKDWLSL